MIATSYLDAFEPIRIHQGSSPDDRIAMMTAGGMQQFGGTDNRRAQKLVRHHTYWNYVAITRICEFCSGQFPQIGRPATGTGAQHLSAVQRNHLRRNYGRVLQSGYDDLEPVPTSHPLVELLCNPNAEDTWEDFAFELLMFWQLTGLAYIWAIPNGFRLPAALIVIPPQWVAAKRDKSGKLLEYEIVPDGDRGRMERVPPEEMFVGRLRSPVSKIDAYSPIDAAPLWSDVVEWIEQSRGSQFRNGANPDAMILLGDKYSQPREDVIAKIKERFSRRTAGVQRHGEPLVVPPDVKVEKWSHSPKEMDYHETGTSARNNNLALHGVPPVVSGIASDYTRATADAGLVVMSQFVTTPKLRRVAGLLQKIAVRFDPRLVVWFEDTTPEDPDLRIRQDQADFEMAALTPNERRSSRGRPTIDEPAYKSGYIGGGKMPLSEAAMPEPDPAPEPQPPEPPAEPDGEEEPDDDEE